MGKRKQYRPEKKMIILREHLENNVPISELAEQYGISVNDIYNWKKKLFEGGALLFERKNGSNAQKRNEAKKVEQLQEKLSNRDEAIAMLLKENIELKKNIDGEL